MKKMQCEVCGSTSIKKVGDTVFECQSCGTQYSKEEVQKLLVEITGTVKIDHSDEVDNALKRAEQFVNDGDTTKAEEYYNKALDLDAENKKANEEIKKIKKEKSLPQNIFLLEKDIDSTKSITRFLKNLKEQNNIAPDIYKEIEIISTTEQYFPFLIINGTYSGSYYGTACYRKLVEYTDWEDYTDFVDGKFVTRSRQIKRPPTIVYDERDKKPSNGTYRTEYVGVYSVSSDLKEYVNLGLIAMLEFSLGARYDDLCENFKSIKPDNIPNDIPFNIFSEDKESLKSVKLRHASSVEEKCDVCAVNCVGGDKAENVSFDYKIDREDISNLYLPIQIIKYVYKGDIYCAINILSTKCKYSDLRYPYLKQLENLVDKHNQENSEREQSARNIQPKGGYGAWAWTIGIFALFIGWYFGKDTYLFRDVFMAFAYTNFGLGAILTILGLINRSRLTKIKKENLKFQEEGIKNVETLQIQYENELEKEYKIFFDNYTGIDSISKCNDIIEKNCDFSCPVSDIVGAEEDDYDSEDFEEAQDEDEYDEED